MIELLFGWPGFQQSINNPGIFLGNDRSRVSSPFQMGYSPFSQIEYFVFLTQKLKKNLFIIIFFFQLTTCETIAEPYHTNTVGVMNNEIDHTSLSFHDDLSIC